MSVCKTNIDEFTRTGGLDVSNPADDGLNYPYKVGLKRDLARGLK